MIGEDNYGALDPNISGEHINIHAMEGKEMRQVMKKFEGLKKGFPKDNQPLKLDLPGPLSGLNIARRVSQGELTIS